MFDISVGNLVKLINLGNPANVSAALADRLRELITMHQLPADYRFPGEIILCDALGVCRGSLREAYRTLEAEGFIVRNRRGTVVSNSEKVLSSMTISTAMEITDFNDLMEFRVVIEAENARLAAIRAKKQDIIRLEYLLAMMDSFRNDISELTKYDMEFHTYLAKITGNWLFEKTMEVATPQFCKGMYKAFEAGAERTVDHAMEYHRKIIDAIKDQDADEASALMRMHIKYITDQGI